MHRFPPEQVPDTVVELLEAIAQRLGLAGEHRLEVMYAGGKFRQMYVHERVDRAEQDRRDA